VTDISIEKLTVGYNEHAIIKDCSLTIADGSLFTLLGPSGCGKTTLLRTLAGFVPVMSGRVRFGQRDVTHAGAHTRDVGMVFQDYALFPDKTVFDNVAYGLRARKVADSQIQKTVHDTLDRVGLIGYEKRRPAELSGGQRQRVALARALAIKPTVLLMDEPLSNLDAKLRLQVRETIADLQREVGITTVLVTHDQEEALALSDRIGLLRDGTLEQVATPQELYQQPVSTYAADFVGGANILPVELAAPIAANALPSIRVEGHPLTVSVRLALDAGKAFIIARGEHLTLLDAARDNTIPATIKRREFLGARTVYSAQLASGASIHVDAKSDTRNFAMGATAFVHFPALHTQLVSQ
jgi:iron(III) transport system ATP-binding protein